MVRVLENGGDIVWRVLMHMNRSEGHGTAIPIIYVA
jgi:hypothetical protein